MMQSTNADKIQAKASKTNARHDDSAKGISMPAVPVLQQQDAGQDVPTIASGSNTAQLQRFNAAAIPQVQKKENKTGLPDNLKSGIENLSGFSMDDTRVHYNSPQPAQLNAYAYAQGSDIHVAPGQEKHLPHEAWHVVQQKQGRVQATIQMKNEVPVNDDVGLETEADVMGSKAAAFQFASSTSFNSDTNVNAQPYRYAPAQLNIVEPNANNPVQLLHVNGEYITKTGRTGKWLLDELKNYFLSNGFSPHGLTTYFKNELVTDTASYTLTDFLVEVGKKAVAEVKRVNELKKTRRKGDKRIKSWTRELKLNRPAWTPEHKELTESGQDIRHIVRNATMKNAIYGEYQYQLRNHDSDIFYSIARSLDLAPGNHPWEAMKNVYNASFLNRDNLFGGGSGVNRVIGLTADPLIALGNRIIAMKDALSAENVTELYQEADQLIQKQIQSTWEQGTRLKKGSETFQGGMEDFYEVITDFLDDAHGQWLDAVADEEADLNFLIGDQIRDIGLNFGFDIPTETSNPLVTARLLKVEELLGNHTPGNPQQLAETLYLFIKGQELSINLQTGVTTPYEEIYRVGKNVKVNQTGEKGTISGRYNRDTGLCKVQFYDTSRGGYQLIGIKELKPQELTII